MSALEYPRVLAFAFETFSGHSISSARISPAATRALRIGELSVQYTEVLLLVLVVVVPSTSTSPTSTRLRLRVFARAAGGLAPVSGAVPELGRTWK